MCVQRRMLKLLMMASLALLLALTASVAPTRVTAQGESCSGSPPPRLKVGTEAHVPPGSRNNLRDKPGKDGGLVGQVPGDSYVFVLDGPQCADDLTWWQVFYDRIGWMAEGSGSDYFVEPVAASTITYQVSTGKVFVSFHTVGFTYQGSFGSTVQALTVPPVLPPGPGVETDTPVDYTGPEYVQFLLTDKADDDTKAHGPVLRVIPAAELQAINRDAKKQLPPLKALLKARPRTIEGEIPFQPSHYAHQVFHSSIAYLEFNAGVGIRYLTEWTQNTYPILSGLVRYTFEGFTEDGKYFVSAEFPVTSSLLATTADDDRDFAAIDLNAPDADAQYDRYKMKIAAKLEAAGPNSFKPPLDEIDRLVRSLIIK